MYGGVHSRLHRIKILNLVRQFCIIVRNYQRIHGSENDRDSWAHRMHGMLAKVKELREVLRCDIGSSSTLLHLLVAALYSICYSQRCIVESIRVKEASIAGLAVSKHDMNTLVMITLYGALQHLTNRASYRTGATGWVAETHPGDTWIGNVSIPLYAKHCFRTDCRGRWRGRRWCCRPLLLSYATYLNLARGQQYATEQHSGKNNQELPFHVALYSSRVTLPALLS